MSDPPFSRRLQNNLEFRSVQNFNKILSANMQRNLVKRRNALTPPDCNKTEEHIHSSEHNRLNFQ